ncbi:MAG: MFS transporter [Betaproteobacteria bacterium]
MTAGELRASFGLAGIYGLRMLGMFIILPIFSLYAEQLPGGSDHTLIGLALGAYGLTQAILQIPFGTLSDHWGRKRTIYLGLVIFAAGSFIAAIAQDIYMVIVGRVIQGSGAISAAVIALAADLTRDQQRTKAMAIIGITIGATFALSMIAGPILNQWIGVPGVFAMTGVLALSAIAVVRWVIPDVSRAAAKVENTDDTRLVALLRHPDLKRLNYGIFALHAGLMALFVVVPFQLRGAGLAAASHWQVYLPVMVGSIILMILPLMWAERGGHQKAAFVASVALLLATQLALVLFATTITGIAVCLILYFTGFNFLEASLPSLISRAAPPGAKGSAVGVYSSIQYVGTFAGAAAGGIVSQHFGAGWVFGFAAALTGIWLLLAAGMRGPLVMGTRTYPLPPMDARRADGLSRRLAGVVGVREALVQAADGVAHLKVDNAKFDEQSVLELIAGET